MTAGEQIVADYAQSAENRSGRLGRVLAIGMSALAVAGASELKNADTAEANSSSPEITNIQTKVLAQVGSRSYSVDSATAKSSVTFLARVRANGLPKKYRTAKNCYWDKNGGYNSGTTIHSPAKPKRVKDVKWFRDNRQTYVCRVPKNISPTGLAKANCGNFWKDRPPQVRLIKTPVVMVRSWAKAKVNVSAESSAEARAQCTSPDGLAYAFAYGRGRGYAAARIKLSTFAKARGRGSVLASVSGSASGKASSSAVSQAEAYCASSTPKNPPPPHKENKPPQGEMKPPNHLYSEGYGKICVDKISDPENDPVQAFSFRVYKKDDPNKAGVGTFTSPVYEEAGGAQCRDIQAPYTNEDYKAVTEAKLTDGPNTVDAKPAIYDFNILKDEF